MLEKQRSKRWAPKSFGGCQTCKRRRVKCDEKKPICQRCIRSEVTCDGYAPPLMRIFEPSSASGTKLHETEASVEQTKHLGPLLTDDVESMSVPVTAIVPRPPSITQFHPSFGSAEELRSLKFFVEKTAALISVYSKREFWSVIIPQAAWEQPAIKHALVAIAILHESLTQVEGLLPDRNYRLIHHYNTAIRAISQGRPRTDVVLIASLLFWTLENFKSSGTAGIAHMEAAIKILAEWNSRQDKTQCPCYDVITKYIEPTVNDGLSHSSVHRVVDVTDTEIESSAPLYDSQVLPTLTPFPSLEVAADHLAAHLKNLLDISWSASRAEILRETVQTVGDQLRRWLGLFRGLNAVGPAFTRRLLVVHHVAATAIAAATNNFMSGHDNTKRKCSKHFRYMVSEIEELLKNGVGSAVATSSTLSHMLPPLFFSAIHCDDESIKNLALNLLRVAARQEGNWNSEIAAKVAESIIALEEENDTGIKIPVQVKNITLSRSGKGLKLHYSHLEIEKELYVDLTWEETEIINMDECTSLIRCYGYQL